MQNVQWWMWIIIVTVIAVVVGLIIIWARAFKQIKTEEKMNTENTSLWDDVKAEFHTLVLTLFYKAKSATFWITVILIFVGLQRGGIEGMMMAILSALGYTGKEAYQNVRFGQLKANNKPQNSPQASVISEDASIIAEPTNPITTPEKQQVIKPVPPPFDITEFEDKVKDRALNVYGVENEITKFFAATDMLGPLPLDPGDYKTAILFEAVAHHGLKAYEEKFGFDYADSGAHLKDNKKCEYYSVANMARQKGIDFWSMLIRTEKALFNASFPCSNWSGLI